MVLVLSQLPDVRPTTDVVTLDTVKPASAAALAWWKSLESVLLQGWFAAHVKQILLEPALAVSS